MSFFNSKESLKNFLFIYHNTSYDPIIRKFKQLLTKEFILKNKASTIYTLKKYYIENNTYDLINKNYIQQLRSIMTSNIFNNENDINDIDPNTRFLNLISESELTLIYDTFLREKVSEQYIANRIIEANSEVYKSLVNEMNSLN